jgi:hypothetical protein
MYFYKKTKFIKVNGKVKQKYNIEMIKNNKGIHIVGVNNNKIINKTITFLNKTKNKITKKTTKKRVKK